MVGKKVIVIVMQVDGGLKQAHVEYFLKIINSKKWNRDVAG